MHFNNYKINSLVFSIFIALITTLLNYYYADIDHIEQLPIIFRKINSNYLLNDFFVNSTSGFGPRYYYSILIAFFSKLISVPLIFFVLTLISNTCVSFITILVSKRLFDYSRPIAYLSAILVMFFDTVSLGSDGLMSTNALFPDRIAFPLIMLSFLFLLDRRIVFSAIISGFASLFHILYGIGYGGIFFLTYCVLILIERESLKNHIRPILVSSIILFGFLLFTLVPSYLEGSEKISDAEFISIIAYFRHPHHYIPSHFLTFTEVIKAIAFFGLALISAFWTNTKYYLRYILIISIIVSILLILGYVFVEINPSRLWVTLQTFRYLNLLKWLSLILISGMIIKILNKYFIINLLIGYFHRLKIIYYTIFVVLSLFIAVKVVYKPNFKFTQEFNNKYFNPKFSLSDYTDDEADIAKYIKKNTDTRDVFLTPPSFGRLRIFAERAVIADFKAFPFSDLAMKGWKKRLNDCYGTTDKAGFAANSELTNNYKLINDKKIINLQQTYDFQYIILYNETETSFPIIFQNNTYKLVKAVK